MWNFMQIFVVLQLQSRKNSIIGHKERQGWRLVPMARGRVDPPFKAKVPPRLPLWSRLGASRRPRAATLEPPGFIWALFLAR